MSRPADDPTWRVLADVLHSRGGLVDDGVRDLLDALELTPKQRVTLLMAPTIGPARIDGLRWYDDYGPRSFRIDQPIVLRDGQRLSITVDKGVMKVEIEPLRIVPG